MHVASRTNLHITQNVATLHVRKGRVFFADRLDSERIILAARDCVELFCANLSHDLFGAMELPADQVVEELGGVLVILGGALPRELEIIERCGMVAGLLGVSVIVASFIP